VLVALVFALLMFVRTRGTGRGDARWSERLEIVYGPGGVVRQIFGPDKLLSASAQNFSFMQMGGWGYRGSFEVSSPSGIGHYDAGTRSRYAATAIDVSLSGRGPPKIS